MNMPKFLDKALRKTYHYLALPHMDQKQKEKF